MADDLDGLLAEWKRAERLRITLAFAGRGDVQAQTALSVQAHQSALSDSPCEGRVGGEDWAIAIILARQAATQGGEHDAYRLGLLLLDLAERSTDRSRATLLTAAEGIAWVSIAADLGIEYAGMKLSSFPEKFDYDDWPALFKLASDIEKATREELSRVGEGLAT